MSCCHMTFPGVNIYKLRVPRQERYWGSYIYRRFYNFTPGNSILQLYLSLVRPHLDYAASIWSPYLTKDKILLENIQKFACGIATRTWDSSYQDLLELVELPTLEHRRLETRLCLLYTRSYTICFILILIIFLL